MKLLGLRKHRHRKWSSVLIQTTITSRIRHLSVKMNTAVSQQYYVRSAHTKVLIRQTRKINPSSFANSATSPNRMMTWIPNLAKVMKRQRWKWSTAQHEIRTNCRKMQEKQIKQTTKILEVLRLETNKWKMSFCSRLKPILSELLLNKILSKTNLMTLDVTYIYI